MKMTKRKKKNDEALQTKEECTFAEAVKILKNLPAKPKFDETVELAIKLGVSQKQIPQPIRGTVNLPSGTGKKISIAVFTKLDQERAKEAGADYVGDDDLLQKVAGGWCNFDVAIAHPKMMPQMSKLGKVLGPKGLMPSPKTGTITDDVVAAVRDVKKGKIEFRMDKQANINVPAGKLSFEENAIIGNLSSIYKAVIGSKPDSVKGQFVESVHLSTTMGPGIKININMLEDL